MLNQWMYETGRLKTQEVENRYYQSQQAFERTVGSRNEPRNI
jgi:hypothetical protein